MNDAKLIEIFAQMWMQCDPSRPGTNPAPPDGQPEWAWFVPQAEASLEFLKMQGVRVSR